MKQLTFAVLLTALPITTANATTITFSDSELLAMTVKDSSNTSFTATGAPFGIQAGTYTDSGLATTYNVGFSGLISSADIPPTLSKLYYGINDIVGEADSPGAVDSAEFLTAQFYNDNNQIWGVGLWAKDSNGLVTETLPNFINGSIDGDPRSVVVELDLDDLGSDIESYGLFVAWDPAQNGGASNDVFHFSVEAVPEPHSLAVWAGLGLVGLTFGRRRREKNEG